MKFRNLELDDQEIEYIMKLLDMARAEIIREIMFRLKLSLADACSLYCKLQVDCDDIPGWIA